MNCPKCGPVFIKHKRSGPHIGAYCLKCGRWIKWLNPKEKELIESLGLITEDTLTDEEMRLEYD